MKELNELFVFVEESLEGLITNQNDYQDGFIAALHLVKRKLERLMDEQARDKTRTPKA